VGSGAPLDRMEKRNISCRFRDSNPDCLCTEFANRVTKSRCNSYIISSSSNCSHLVTNVHIW
jgi:hypothetical protein